MQRYLLLISLLLFVTACAPDPRKEAEAFQIRTEAEQKALTDAQNRDQSEQLFELEKQRLQAQIAMTETNKKTREIGWNVFLVMVFLMGTGAVAYSIYFGTQSTMKAYQIISIGLAEAAIQAADVQSRLIKLDPQTGNYPLVYAGKGVFYLADANTNTVLQLDTAKEGDRLMIQGAMATRHTLVLSNNAAKSKDPAGISIIDAPRWQEREL